MQFDFVCRFISGSFKCSLILCADLFRVVLNAVWFCVKYNDVKYNDVKYNDVKYNDVKYNDVKYNDVKLYVYVYVVFTYISSVFHIPGSIRWLFQGTNFMFVLNPEYTLNPQTIKEAYALTEERFLWEFLRWKWRRKIRISLYI